MSAAISEAHISNFKCLQRSKTQPVRQVIPLITTSDNPTGNQLVQFLVLLHVVVACEMNINMCAALVLMKIVQYL